MLRTIETPEEEELRAKLGELRQLERQLADGEASLITKRRDLELFERRYLRLVGRRLAELDEIEAGILRAQSKGSSDAELRTRAREASARAEQSRRAASASAETPSDVADVSGNEDLRRLYREVARQVHPDLAPDESARAIRTDFMARANQAYAEGDRIALTKLLDEWKSRPEEVRGDSVAAELVRTIRRIAQAKRRLQEIDAETAELSSSALGSLWRDQQDAAATGRDLLAEMAERLDAELTVARMRLRRAEAVA